MTDVKNLTIYTKSLDLVTKIYILIRTNQSLAKDFSLCDQIKRASVSTSCNISEGYMRSRKQFKNYLDILSGSTNEVITLLTVIEKVYGIDTEQLQNEYLYLGRQIKAFSKSFI